MPTLSAAAVTNLVQRPDILSVEGNVKVLAAGVDQSGSLPAGIPRRFMRFMRMRPGGSSLTYIEQKDLKNLKLTSGISGRSEVEYHFLVEGKGNITINLDCVKGGKQSKSIALQ